MKRLEVCQSFILLGLFALLINSAHGSVQLSALDTVYLPAAGEQKPAFDKQAVEQVAYDPVKKFIYGSGDGVYHVIDASNAREMKIKYTYYEPGTEFSDVSVCGDHVFMLAHKAQDHLKGALRVYKTYVDNHNPPLELVKEFQVGPQPDALIVLEDCKTAIVAVEGEAFLSDGNLVDPEGEIVIVHFPDGPAKAQDSATVTPLVFDEFNNRYNDLKPSGVRFVYRANNNKLSNDLEPEFIAVDEASHKAYVVLQENNAIAEVDLKDKKITDIHGLGYKEWGSLDASDRDLGIHISFWPIRAWYNPDGITFHQWQGRKLLFTANEGDGKDYDTPAFDEAVRGAEIAVSDLGPDIHQIVKLGINDEKQLGRLKFSREDGKEASGKYSALYTFGGRSFSIWDVTDGGGDTSHALPLLFDSGSQLEELTALHCPHLFNREENVPDDRSDDKGLEPESITVGEIDGRLYIFIGLERPGSIAVYSLGHDLRHARFETMYCAGIPNRPETLRQMFTARQAYGADPEDIQFIPASKSPTGKPVLLLPGTVTSSVTLLDIKATHDDHDDDEFSRECPGSGVIKAVSLLLMSACLLFHLW